tara:strand:- start:917 stop:1762 length:846 start_codon:yes stop_codon:yes gene_type:complete
MNTANIKWLHVEPSSKCNAWCPGCPRNNNGYGLAPGLVEEDLSPDRFKEILSEFTELHAIQLCGNFGDPLASKHVDKIIDMSLQHATKLQIHTNGSLKSKTWWRELGSKLNGVNHDVWFGIDGLKGVHEIYRQGTSFNKIIDNASEFISAGGYATWQFIPYAHNEHQVKDAIRLSQKLGFKKFKLAKVYRKKTDAFNYKTGEYYELLPTKELWDVITKVDELKPVEFGDCMHLSMPSIYVNADGTLSRCCYLSKEKFVTVEELMNKETDLTDAACMRSCGG